MWGKISSYIIYSIIYRINGENIARRDRARREKAAKNVAARQGINGRFVNRLTGRHVIYFNQVITVVVRSQVFPYGRFTAFTQHGVLNADGRRLKLKKRCNFHLRDVFKITQNCPPIVTPPFGAATSVATDATAPPPVVFRIENCSRPQLLPHRSAPLPLSPRTRPRRPRSCSA
jgi:hypothetical protein